MSGINEKRTLLFTNINRNNHLGKVTINYSMKIWKVDILEFAKDLLVNTNENSDSLKLLNAHDSSKANCGFVW